MNDTKDLGVIWGFMPVGVLLIALIALILTMPYQRGNSLAALQMEYSVPPPKVVLQKGEEKERSIVFIPKSEKVPAVIYMLESENILGKQDWLNRGYQTYALTHDELKKLQNMRQQHIIDQGLSSRQKNLDVAQNPPINLDQRVAGL